MIKNLIFDFGAVLVDWDPHYVYDKHFGNREKADWFLENVCTYPWNLKQDGGRPTSEAEEELIQIWPEYEKEIKMYYGEFLGMMGGQLPGMEECLVELKKDFHLFGLSNWSGETFALVEHKYPIFNLMEDKVISGRVKMLKPNKDIFEYALEKFGIRAEESVFIDDRLENIEGAEACGIHGIHYKDKEQLLADIKKLQEYCQATTIANH